MIYYRCPHCNRPYSCFDSDISERMGQQGTCNGDMYGKDKGCGKKFIRIETKEKLHPIKTICYKCFTIWNVNNGIIGTYRLCGENRNDGCGKEYHGFEWLGQQAENNLISNMASFFSFGLIGERKQKCPRCFSTTYSEHIAKEVLQDQIIVSNPNGIQEWHNQALMYFACFKCLVSWSHHRHWKA